jgi:hypothetical protein
MGKQKSRLRAAKQRAAREQTPRRDYGTEPLTVEAIGNVLVTAAYELANGNAAAAKDCAAELTSERFPNGVDDIEIGADKAVKNLLDRVFKGGWLPDDLHQITRRRLDEFAVGYVTDRLAAYLEPFPPATVHPTWRDQLEQLDATVWWSPEQAHFGQWAIKHILTPEEALITVVEVFALLVELSPLDLIVPLPGTVQNQRMTGHHSVNEKMLGRVRALLAKAESSAFPEEAEALSAKAQELMTRHALDRVLVEADAATQNIVSSQRIWLDTPYLDAKSLLVDVVATANRCRAIFHAAWGFVSVLGDENDLEAVDLLMTSLLLQATRAMIANGDQPGYPKEARASEARTRAYRQSFLVAYATRIGERLERATVATIEEAPDAARLLPVLASRRQKVDEAFEIKYPAAVGKRVSVRNAAGWGAGKEAADKAHLETRRSIGD